MNPLICNLLLGTATIFKSSVVLPAQPTVMTCFDSFVSANDPSLSDLKEQLISLAKSKNSNVSFTVNSEDFKIESVLPKSSIRTDTILELTIDGKKYEALYIFPNDENKLSVPGFYFQTDESGFKNLNSIIKNNSAINISKIDIPILIALIEPEPEVPSFDLTNDGIPDISHGFLIVKILQKKLNNEGINTRIKLVPWEPYDFTKLDKRSFSFNQTVPDIILAPMGVISSATNSLNDDELQNIDFLKKIIIQFYEDKDPMTVSLNQCRELFEELVSQGTTVLVSAGNEPREVNPLAIAKGVKVIGSSGNTPNSIADYSARNALVTKYVNDKFKVYFLYNNNEFIGFDFDGDDKPDISMQNDKDWINPQFSPILNFVKSSSKEVFTDEEFKKIIKMLDGFRFHIIDNKPALVMYRKNKLDTDSKENLPLDKLFNFNQINEIYKTLLKDQNFNLLNDPSVQKQRQKLENSLFFIFNDGSKTNSDSFYIQSLVIGVIDQKNQDSTQKSSSYSETWGTSFAIIQEALQVALSKNYIK